MPATSRGAEDPSKSFSLAKSFSNLGWVGFWAQIVIGFVPILLTAYTFIFNRSAGGGTRGGFALVEILALAGLVVLAFTTVWFYRYTRLGVRIADAQNRPPSSAVVRAVWTGVAASVIGIVFSILVMLFDVIQILFYFLRAPQVGIPTVQTTTAGAAASWVSAADIVSLLILILILLVEIVVLALSLWLLFRASSASVEYPAAVA